MWHWDQGRLAYFQFDALRQMSIFLPYGMTSRKLSALNLKQKLVWTLQRQLPTVLGGIIQGC